MVRRRSEARCAQRAEARRMRACASARACALAVRGHGGVRGGAGVAVGRAEEVDGRGLAGKAPSLNHARSWQWWFSQKSASCAEQFAA